MKPKIFKSVAYAIAMLMASHLSVAGQNANPDPDKLEQKLKQMEQKLNQMQKKLDGMSLQNKMPDDALAQDLRIDIPALKQIDANKIIARIDSQVFVLRGNASLKKRIDSLQHFSPQTFVYVEPGVVAPPIAPMPNIQLMPLPDEPQYRSGANSGVLIIPNTRQANKELTKTVTKAFSVGRNTKLAIDNRYGSVTINTWNKNEFKVEVYIKVWVNDDASATKLLDNVSITDSKDGDTVNIKTNIKNSGNGFWGMLSGGEGGYRKMQIDYVVFMPSKNELKVKNLYGSISLPDFDGKVTIYNSYGSLSAGSLNNAANNIVSRYGSANIQSLGGGVLKSAYGSLNVGTANGVNADISYGSANIERIKTSANISVRYGGGFQITDVDKDLKDLHINASYTNIALGVNTNTNANFDVTVSYGNFTSGGRNTTINNDGGNTGNTRVYHGRLGKSGNGVVVINARYGNVRFD